MGELLSLPAPSGFSLHLASDFLPGESVGPVWGYVRGPVQASPGQWEWSWGVVGMVRLPRPAWLGAILGLGCDQVIFDDVPAGVV